MNDFINESSISEKELLNFIQDNGMIDLINIKQQLDMQKKEKILQNHKYKIWQGSNGKWHTYIPDPVKGRRLINRSTREDVEQAIIDNEQSGDSFQERFEVWVKRQEDCGVSPNTVRRYRTDYNRFFAGETIEKMALKNIDSDFLEAFFIRKIKEKKFRIVPYKVSSDILAVSLKKHFVIESSKKIHVTTSISDCGKSIVLMRKNVHQHEVS